MTRVYFATNRRKDASKPGGFGTDIVPMDRSAVLYAIADVQGTDLVDENSGTIASITEQAAGGYSDDAVEQIVGAGKNLLVFIHGFANSFEDGVKHAAFNADWLRQRDCGGRRDGARVLLAFGRRARGLAAASRAGGLFQRSVAGWQVRLPSRLFSQQHRPVAARLPEEAAKRSNVPGGAQHGQLCPAGSRAVVVRQSRLGRDLMFDEAILAAADEVNDTFERPNGGRLSNLPKLAKRITVYYSRKDVAMYVSTTLNLTKRLGFDGPGEKRNHATYPPSRFRIADCTEVNDFDLLNPPDATHQYYRRSMIVRADIAKVMNRDGGGGLVML